MIEPDEAVGPCRGRFLRRGGHSDPAANGGERPGGLELVRQAALPHALLAGGLVAALFLIVMLGGFAQERSLADLVSAMAGAACRLGPVALALEAMMRLSRVLVHSGMIETVAQAAAASGGLSPFISPFIGMLGTFVTGSATSSNILFSDFQQVAATALSLRRRCFMARRVSAPHYHRRCGNR